jgi:hypothetical protein
MGTLRNLSRAGHLSSDVDGYGIHRAWLSACLVEVAPYEGLGAADAIGLDPEMKSWFRWYIDQHVGFVQRLSTYEKSGLPVRMPYGQNITIEKQFCALLASRCYSYLARALYEYDDLAAMPAVEPPAHLGYAWWHNWLRVSTPAYETSFVGTTSLRHLPVVRHFGDPNLGCIHGGSPLSMLFVNNRLMYATSNDPAGLWHAEIIDVNGNLHRSCATSFADETAMAVKTSDGRLLSRDDFKAYEDPFYNTIHDKTPAEVIWSKNLRSQGFRFSIHNSYAPDTLHLNWGMHFPRGFYVESAAFLLAVPINMNPEVQFGDNNWVPLSSITQKDQWPTALRWSDGVAMVTTSLKPSSAQFAGKFRVIPLEPKLRAPGGENSFCPYPLYQLRLEVKMDTTLEAAALSADMSFHTESIK